MNNLRGAKIIYQESKATQPSHLYFLQKDANYCEVIVTSESGVKRRLNSSVDLSNYYTKNETDLLLENYYLKTETYSQNEVDSFLDLKADLSQLNNYYTKSETFSQSQINTYLGSKLDKGGYTRTAQDLKNDIDSKANILHIHDISSITNLQTTLDGKLNKGSYEGTAGDLNSQILNLSQSLQDEQTARVSADLLKQDILSSYDESILIENGGNIEGNISLFEEYFEQQECELNFEPIQIVAVYQDGIKLSSSEYEIILPKKIKIKEYVDENIQIEYTHLKS